MSRKDVKIEGPSISKYDFSGSIDDVIDRLKILKEERYTHIDVSYGEEYYVFLPYYTRLENDEEYNTRIYEEKQSKEARRRYYEKLKEEFENE